MIASGVFWKNERLTDCDVEIYAVRPISVEISRERTPLLGMIAEILINLRPSLANRLRVSVESVKYEILPTVDVDAFQTVRDLYLRVAD